MVEMEEHPSATVQGKPFKALHNGSFTLFQLESLTRQIRATSSENYVGEVVKNLV